MDVDKEAQLQDATGAGGAGPSSGDKRPREDDSGGEGGCALPQDQDRAIDAQVESHRRGAEQSYKNYHDLLAKRARLTREVQRLVARRVACRRVSSARGVASWKLTERGLVTRRHCRWTAQSSSKRPGVRSPRSSTRIRPPALPGSRSYLRPRRRWRRRRSGSSQRNMPGASKPHPSSPSRSAAAASPPPRLPFCLFRRCIGDGRRGVGD